MNPADLVNLITSDPTRDNVIALLVIVGIAGRLYHAAKSEGGIIPAIKATIFGTNTPKK